MALLDNLLNIGATAMGAAATHVSLHTAAPNSSGSNAATSARQPVTWGTAANGDVIATVPINFTGVASGGPVTHVGFWSALTSGTFYGSQALSNDQTANTAGEYGITALALNGSST